MGAVVRDATERSEALIDALLVLARSDRGLAVASPVDLAAVTAESLAQVAGEAAAAGVRVDTDLRPAEVVGDRHLLDRLVGNLIENAWRHNEPSGWVEVLTGEDGDGAWVRVENTGPVIPGVDVDGLFEPFRRLTGERTAGTAGLPAGAGLGLGLSIVRSVATAHGGTATARPRPGGGLTVEVRFPPVAETLSKRDNREDSS